MQRVPLRIKLGFDAHVQAGHPEGSVLLLLRNLGSQPRSAPSVSHPGGQSVRPRQAWAQPWTGAVGLRLQGRGCLLEVGSSLWNAWKDLFRSGKDPSSGEGIAFMTWCVQVSFWVSGPSLSSRLCLTEEKGSGEGAGRKGNMHLEGSSGAEAPSGWRTQLPSFCCWGSSAPELSSPFSQGRGSLRAFWEFTNRAGPRPFLKNHLLLATLATHPTEAQFLNSPPKEWMI